MKKIINTENAPKAIGAYSQAVQIDNLLYISGQIGLDTNTMELVSDDFIRQAEQTFKNIEAILAAAGGQLSNVIKFNVSVTDLGNFQQLNEVFIRYLTEPFPARAAIEVSALPKGAVVEIETIAYID